MKEKNEQTNSTQTVIMPCKVDKEKKIVCDMCGHANPEDSAICEMCSNYLQRR